MNSVKEMESELARALIHTLKEGNRKTFRELVENLKAYDLALQFKNLPTKHHPLFLEYVTDEEITSILRHLSKRYQLHLLQTVEPTRATAILNQMENDDLADLLSGMQPDEANRLISEMQKAELDALQQIMNYPKKSAGRKMTNRYIWVHTSYSVAQAIGKLRSFSLLAEYVNYLYVIDDEKKLAGVVSYRDLLLANPKDAIIEIMTNHVIQVDPYITQEQVAKLFGRYDFVSIPVTDQENHLLGIITIDDVFDIVVRAANEDIEMLLASGKEIDFRTPPLTAAKRRLPWLILLLMIGLVSGSIIARFEATLEAVVALAFFMPMIAGMTGNTGTQSLAVVVRGLVSEDIDIKTAGKLIFREFSVSLLIGFICAVTIAAIAFIWQGNLVLGLVVGASLFATLIIGTMAGTIIPLILHQFKVDPAVASGPLITTINDILSLLIYFGIATMFLSYL